MATGDTFRSGGIDDEIVWSGTKDDPSLLDDDSRLSTLAREAQIAPRTAERSRTRRRATDAQAKARVPLQRKW